MLKPEWQPRLFAPSSGRGDSRSLRPPSGASFLQQSPSALQGQPNRTREKQHESGWLHWRGDWATGKTNLDGGCRVGLTIWFNLATLQRPEVASKERRSTWNHRALMPRSPSQCALGLRRSGSLTNDTVRSGL